MDDPVSQGKLQTLLRNARQAEKTGVEKVPVVHGEWVASQDEFGAVVHEFGGRTTRVAGLGLTAKEYGKEAEKYTP